MNHWRMPLIVALILIPALPLAAAGILYQYAAAQTPVDLKPGNTQYSDEARQIYWRLLGGSEHGIEIRRTDAASYLASVFLLPDFARSTPDIAVLQNASRLNCGSIVTDRRHGNLLRHLIEFACAIRISHEWTPEQIIDTTLDRAGYGRDATSLSTAAMAYYGKDIEALTSAQLLALLVLTHGYSFLDPDCHPERFARHYHLLAQRGGFAGDDMTLDAALQDMQRTPCSKPSTH
ncbi:MAG: transglycosylase domain-containing protein [Xanthomonadaceae bacterium]|jgi:hypothetical protein|nr:transglycosylase domain-containing protein [Xanthomonadaceae bacterium]